MPVHLSLEYQDYSDPMFDFVSKPENMALIGLSLGYPVDAGRFATVARQQKKKKIHDVFPLPGVNAVSERFKEKPLEAINVAWRPEVNIQPILDWVKQNGLPTVGRASRFLKNYV
ncbi:hypothetical protein [Roseibium sp.]|uniref:hypothetical protein n=1 Tax=Roseibium sp. TaxID=1936156 RepID=UPI003B500DB8